MSDIGTARHAAEYRAETRVGEHLLGEDNEYVMYIVLWYGSGDAVQVSRSLSQLALNSNYIVGRRVYVLGKLAHIEARVQGQLTFLFPSMLQANQRNEL
jgi:hypothetical protein